MLAPDFIEAIPKHLRDDLYFQLHEWYHSDERKGYIKRNQEKHHNQEIERNRRKAIQKKQAFKPQKI